jgi:hypothetical protein
MDSWLRGRSDAGRAPEHGSNVIGAELVGGAAGASTAASGQEVGIAQADGTTTVVLAAVAVASVIMGLLQFLCGLLSGFVGLLGVTMAEGDASDGLTMLMLLGLGLLVNFSGIVGILAAVGLFRRVRRGRLLALVSGGLSGLHVLGGLALIPFGVGWMESI